MGPKNTRIQIIIIKSYCSLKLVMLQLRSSSEDMACYILLKVKKKNTPKLWKFRDLGFYLKVMENKGTERIKTLKD